MRARLVFENINFKRGQDSKRSLGVGRIAEIRKWWSNNITNRPEINFNLSFNKIWNKILEISKEEGIELKISSPSGNGGSWNGNKFPRTQTANTIFHLPGHITHYFNFDVDEDGDVWVTTPQYLTGGKAKHELGSMTENPVELVYNLRDYIDNLEDEVIPHYEILKSKKSKVSESVDFVRGKTTKDALTLGSVAQRQKWWDDIKAQLRSTGNLIDVAESVAYKVSDILGKIGLNAEPSGLGHSAFGLDVLGGEYSFDFDPDGNVLIRGVELGNLINDPENIGINFKKIYDQLDFASDIWKLLPQPKVKLKSPYDKNRERKRPPKKWHDRFNPFKI